MFPVPPDGGYTPPSPPTRLESEQESCPAAEQEGHSASSDIAASSGGHAKPATGTVPGTRMNTETKAAAKKRKDGRDNNDEEPTITEPAHKKPRESNR